MFSVYENIPVPNNVDDQQICCYFHPKKSVVNPENAADSPGFKVQMKLKMYSDPFPSSYCASI